MSDWKCEECGDIFDSRKGLHRHMRCHFDSIGEYYVKHFPKKDLFSQDQIPFKNYDQYFSTDFLNIENYIKWIKCSPASKTKPYILKQFKEKAEHKDLQSMPANLFFDLYQMPNRFTLGNLWGNYDLFCEDAGLLNWYKNDLPDDFWDKACDDFKILIDTREQKPIIFDHHVFQKLDFGDYTAAGDFYTRTFVDRKSQDDFRSTFGKDIERFRREMDRCVQFGSYMFVVVESNIDQIEKDNQHNKFKSNLTYLWHNVRDLMASYPQNLQFIFAHNRSGAKKIIPKILFYGDKLWRVDLQYHIDNRVYGKQHIHQLS